MIIAMFRTYLQPQANHEELRALEQKMYALVSTMPGFISVKQFAAEDGEALGLAEFESLESLKAWKEHPEHVVAQRRGRVEFFAAYHVQVCRMIRKAKFTAQTV